MPRITFIDPSGNRTEVDAIAGQSVMQAAVSGGVEGIVAECGGSMMCATCHCYVEEPWLASLEPASAGEAELLTLTASSAKPSSRLSCQISITNELDGLIIRLPEAQQ